MPIDLPLLRTETPATEFVTTSPHPAGTLTIRLNDVFIGTLKGVPREAVPGALLSGKGDMVRLKGVWSERDQQMIDAGAVLCWLLVLMLA